MHPLQGRLRDPRAAREPGSALAALWRTKPAGEDLTIKLRQRPPIPRDDIGMGIPHSDPSPRADPPLGSGRSGRAGGAPRCQRCALHAARCICDSLAPRWCATRVAILIHQKETRKTTNTGRLVPLLLANSELRVRGRRGAPLCCEDLVTEPDRARLLFPSDDAEDLRELEGPITLIVPDGNWRQARKVVKREPAFARLKRVRLPPGPPSRYRLRHDRDPERLATIEAVARALGILEGPALQAHLEDAFERMVEETLASRGVPYQPPPRRSSS